MTEVIIYYFQDSVIKTVNLPFWALSDKFLWGKPATVL